MKKYICLLLLSLGTAFSQTQQYPAPAGGGGGGTPGGGANSLQTNVSGAFSGNASDTLDTSGNLSIRGTGTFGNGGGTNGKVCLNGATSGVACFGAIAVQGTPSIINPPTTDPTNGQVLTAGTPSGGALPTSWTTVVVTDELNFFIGRDVGGGVLETNTDSSNVTSSAHQADLNFYTVSNAGTPYVAIHHRLPSTWTGNVDLKIFWDQSNGGSGTVQFDIQTWCIATGGTLSATSYNAAQSQTPATGAGNALVETDQNTLTMTGCAAGNQLVVKVSRNNTVGGNYASAINLFGITLVVRHT